MENQKVKTGAKATMSGLVHKLFGTTPGDGNVQPKEAFAYSFAGLGQNLICGLVGSFVSYYFTNGLLMAPATVGIIMLVVRIFDALNDPIMGSIVDRTRTKHGKCRPYLMWMPIPIAIFTVLLFLPLPPSTMSTIAIATTIYVIWSVVYTIVDVPYWGLATSMTDDTNKRGSILMVARLFCTVGAGVISLMVPQISGLWIKDYVDASGAIIKGMEGAAAAALRSNYWWLALILVVIAVPTFFIGYKFTKERYYSDSKPPTLKQNVKYLVKNKPLMLIVLSGVLGAARTLYMYSGIYVAQYNLTQVLPGGFMGMTGVGLFTLITIAVIPGGLIASLMVPWCTKKFGKKNTFIWSHIFGAVVLFIMYFCGWQKDWALIINLIGLVLVGIPQGFANIISYAMIGDTVEYLELKTGERAEGICFAMQTLINKMGMAIGAAISCFGLAWAHIDANIASTQTIAGNEAGLNLFFLISVLIPAVSMLLCAIPLFFYKFNEKEQHAAIIEIAERKERVNNEIEMILAAANSSVIVSTNDVIIRSISSNVSTEEIIRELVSKADSEEIAVLEDDDPSVNNPKEIDGNVLFDGDTKSNDIVETETGDSETVDA
ncbi:MAG: glycoside-pentoside-hexuronide (GPH):cation symporter, partial [Clostridia bacterium]